MCLNFAVQYFAVNSMYFQSTYSNKLMQVVSSISWTHVASKTHGHFTLRVCCWNLRFHNLECSPHSSLLPEPAPHTSFDMSHTLISYGFRSGEREGLKPPAWLLSPNTHSAIWIVYCVSSCIILVRKLHSLSRNRRDVQNFLPEFV
jgi:hypothetical protein